MGDGPAVAIYILTIGLLNLALGYGLALWFERRRRVAIWRQSIMAVDIELTEKPAQDVSPDELAPEHVIPKEIEGIPTDVIVLEGE